MSFCIISWGHIEGVRAEKGPPGVGTKSEPVVYVGSELILSPSPRVGAVSSSCSDKVSTEDKISLE